MTKHILVTGGAGFIGTHVVCELLSRGYTPIVIDNEKTGKRANVPSGVEFIHGDVRNPDDLDPIFARGIDAVMHIAGQASIRLSFIDPGADLSVNTVGTINVLQACMKYHVSRLIYASSMTVYGNATTIPTPETAPAEPVSYYALTKYAGERYLHIAAERKDLDFPFHVTSFRMFNVYGERQSLTNPYQGVLAIFIGNVMRGEPITIHWDGEQSRDFVYVGDVARAWVDALDNPATYGRKINLGTGAPLTMNALCDHVLAAFGQSRATYEVRHSGAQPGDTRHSAADITLAGELLGWSPRVSFAEGIRTTVAWARQSV
jgi:UDP-glucose 4-epimerase